MSKLYWAGMWTGIMALLPNVAHAYIDPGSGALILQALIGVIATFLLTIKLWWRKLYAFLGRKKDSSKDDDKPQEDNSADESH